MTHDPIEELLGAYALDAVDDDERAAVEAHLATCPRCRAEVDSHREVAAHLAAGAPAPEGLWDRIAEALEGETPPPLRLVIDRDVPVAPADQPGAEVVRLRPRQRIGVLAAAAAAVVAIVGLSISSINQQDRIDDMEAAQGLEQAALDAFAAPDARLADLTGEDGTVIRAVVLPDGTGYLLADDLPDVGDRIYQLWGATGDHVVSLGPMGSDPTVESFAANEDITTLMLTVEDEVVETSSNPAVVVGELS